MAEQLNLDFEEWRKIDDWPYEISSWGRLRSLRRWINASHGSVHFHPERILKGGRDSDGYWMAILSFDGKRRGVKIHQLVCSYFNGKRPIDKTMVAHRDGNKENNHKNNLYWATCKENKEDSIRHGTSVRGERHGSSKLSEAQVRQIKTLVRGGAHVGDLSTRFGVERHAISRIKAGISWGWLR